MTMLHAPRFRLLVPLARPSSLSCHKTQPTTRHSVAQTVRPASSAFCRAIVETSPVRIVKIRFSGLEYFYVQDEWLGGKKGEGGKETRALSSDYPQL